MIGRRAWRSLRAGAGERSASGNRIAALLMPVLALSFCLIPGPLASTAESAGPASAAEAASPNSDHWSLQPLRRPALPTTWAPSVVSPIDAFLSARLAGAGLALSPTADRLTLIRRVTFDLTGLPPTPAEIDAFVADRSPGAYETLVERLLASPRYGERWARHWLDVARYTESQGFEYDRLRDNAWHYRDYVIRSFNADKPYDQFMREQIAGDVLEPVTSDGIVATSLLVCGPWDEAGNSQANATQKAITREEEMEDLVSVVGQTFLGLTVNCARCHAHKFDPIPQEEYYRVKSVFDGVKHGERPIATPAEVAAREARIASLKREIADAGEVVAGLEREGRTRATGALPLRAPAGPTPYALWAFDAGSEMESGGELKGGAKSTGRGLELRSDGDFFQSAPLTRDIREKTLEAWVRLANLEQRGGGAISLETEGGAVFDAIVFGERQPRRWTAGSNGFERTRDLEVADEMAGPEAVVHLAVVYRDDNSIAVFRNGEAYGAPYAPASTLRTFPAQRSRILLGLRHSGGGRPWLTGTIVRAALYDRALSAAEVAESFRAGGKSIPLSDVLAALTDSQRAEREQALARVRSAREALDRVEPLPVSYAGTRVQPAVTHRLRRGDVKSPEEAVAPSGLSAIQGPEPDFGLPADAPEAERRRRFGAWLADPRNPLPARVMANRVWHYHFGQGLVATPNDFGASGARPTHPELLDWLASQFQAGGWSVKALHRLILNSAAYRQSSEFDARAAALDPDHHLLWRYPPRRLEGEAVRDAMLAAAGQLNLAIGGPGFRAFEVLKFPANAYVPTDKIGPEFDRRTVYRMNVNSGKEPLLDALDCPEPSVKSPRRGVTSTPLQALGLMNGSFVQRQASNLATRVSAEELPDSDRAIRLAYRLTVGRDPGDDELQRARSAAQARGLATVCWALFNSTEFMYVR